MHNQDAPDTLIVYAPLALHEELVQRTARGQDIAQIAGLLLVNSLERFEKRVWNESLPYILQDYTESLTKRASTEVVALTLPLARQVTVRLRVAAQKFDDSAAKLALMCLANGLDLS